MMLRSQEEVKTQHSVTFDGSKTKEERTLRLLVQKAKKHSLALISLITLFGWDFYFP